MEETNQPDDARLAPVRAVYDRAQTGLLVYSIVRLALRILRLQAGEGDWIDAHIRLLKWLLPLRILANVAALILIVSAFGFGYTAAGDRAGWMIYAVVAGFSIEILTRLDYTPRMRRAARAFAHGLPPHQAPPAGNNEG